MAAIPEGASWSTVAARSVPLAAVWWALAEGVPGSWWVGVPAVVMAALASAILMPPVPIVWRELLRFVPFFLRRSLLGGLDVARRAFDPRLPIAPGIIDYGFRLPPGLPRVMLANTISLLPGTLGAGMEGDVLKVHVLDEGQDVAGEIAEVEQAIARLFGIAL